MVLFFFYNFPPWNLRYIIILWFDVFKFYRNCSHNFAHFISSFQHCITLICETFDFYVTFLMIFCVLFYCFFFLYLLPSRYGLGEGNSTPLQYSCLENPMDRGAWWAAVHGVTRVGPNWATSLSLLTFMHWRRKWQPTPVFLPGESQGRGILVLCWGRTE